MRDAHTIAGLKMEDLDTFLARYPPFDAVGPGELRSLAGEAEQHTHEAGDVVLVEDGLPTRGLWVILSGSMELLHEGEVIQVLQPGECFGHPSLLTGMAPAYTVRARERSTSALIGAQAGRRVLGSEGGAAYVARTMRGRLVRTGQTVHGLAEVGTTPVSAIMRPAAFCAPDAPIRDAARQLGEEGVSVLLIRLGGGALGMVTDADVRARVASEWGADDPARAIARTPVPSVPSSHLAIEATVDMLAAGSEHVAVLDEGEVCGVVSASDLLGLDARGPIALRHAILGSADEEELIRTVRRLPNLFLLLLRAGVPSPELGRVLSLQHDAVTTRLIEFAIQAHGQPPLPWAWLHMGSVARREFTLASDQDNALAYANPRPGEETAVDQFFERLGSDVNDGLARCGIGLDNNGVLAGRRLWRMSEDAWLQTFDEVLRQPDESHLIRASVAFDFRPTVGGLAISGELTGRIRAARGFPNFMRLMARTATGYSVPLGFRGQLATGREDDPEGRLDIKRGGVIPVVNLVRFHALANGVTVSSTLDRIEAVASVGGLERDAADALSEAFAIVTRIRFEHHAQLIAAGAPPDNLIDPGQLAPITHTELREALQVVRRAQKRLAGWVPPGP